MFRIAQWMPLHISLPHGLNDFRSLKSLQRLIPGVGKRIEPQCGRFSDSHYSSRPLVSARGKTLVVCNWKCYTPSASATKHILRFSKLKVPENVKVTIVYVN